MQEEKQFRLGYKYFRVYFISHLFSTFCSQCESLWNSHYCHTVTSFSFQGNLFLFLLFEVDNPLFWARNKKQAEDT